MLTGTNLMLNLEMLFEILVEYVNKLYEPISLWPKIIPLWMGNKQNKTNQGLIRLSIIDLSITHTIHGFKNIAPKIPTNDNIEQNNVKTTHMINEII